MTQVQISTGTFLALRLEPGDDLVAGLLAQQGGDDGVLAGTGAEDEDLHAISLPTRGASARGPLASSHGPHAHPRFGGRGGAH